MNPIIDNTLSPTFILSIDVEDWFQVENFKNYIPFSSWPNKHLRVETNTHFFLDLFDSIELGSNDRSLKVEYENNHQRYHNLVNRKNMSSIETYRKVKCTFFMLGWIAECLPNLVREIYSRGHEVASHGYKHDLCTKNSSIELKKDLTYSKKLLEDIIGNKIYGYRAPSFSIDDDIIKVIEDCEYTYDSSYNSFHLHNRYGKMNLDGKIRKGIAYKISNNFYELPISNLKIFNFDFPWGGGGYFRMLNLFLFKMGVKSILNKEGTYVFYIHPWEVDPQQPRVSQAPWSFKFRHYLNLNKTHRKLLKMMHYFSYCRFISCRQYLEKLNVNSPLPVKG